MHNLSLQKNIWTDKDFQTNICNEEHIRWEGHVNDLCMDANEITERWITESKNMDYHGKQFLRTFVLVQSDEAGNYQFFSIFHTVWGSLKYNSSYSHPGIYLAYTGEQNLAHLFHERRIGATWAVTHLASVSYGLSAWQGDRQLNVLWFSREKNNPKPPACDAQLTITYKMVQEFLLKIIL